MQHELASRAPIFVQNENLPIFRGFDGKKAGAGRGPAARAGRQERRALGDLGRAGKAPPPPAVAGRKAASAVGESVQGSKPKGVVKPSSLSDGDWMKCCEWAKGGVETASFTGNDMQRLTDDKHEERIRKKVEKAMGALQISMESIYDSDVPSQISIADSDDETKLELDPEILPSTAHLSSRLGENGDSYFLSDLEFEHALFVDRSFDLKLKDDY